MKMSDDKELSHETPLVELQDVQGFLEFLLVLFCLQLSLTHHHSQMDQVEIECSYVLCIVALICFYTILWISSDVNQGLPFLRISLFLQFSNDTIFCFLDFLHTHGLRIFREAFSCLVFTLCEFFFQFQHIPLAQSNNSFTFLPTRDPLEMLLKIMVMHCISTHCMDCYLFFLSLDHPCQANLLCSLVMAVMMSEI